MLRAVRPFGSLAVWPFGPSAPRPTGPYDPDRQRAAEPACVFYVGGGTPAPGWPKARLGPMALVGGAVLAARAGCLLDLS